MRVNKTDLVAFIAARLKVLPEQVTEDTLVDPETQTMVTIYFKKPSGYEDIYNVKVKDVFAQMGV